MPGSLNDGWYDGEVWFKVSSRDELKRIPPLIQKQRVIGDVVIEIFEWLPAKFDPVEILPSSDCRLKNEKWFWCNKPN